MRVLSGKEASEISGGELTWQQTSSIAAPLGGAMIGMEVGAFHAFAAARRPGGYVVCETLLSLLIGGFFGAVIGKLGAMTVIAIKEYVDPTVKN